MKTPRCLMFLIGTILLITTFFSNPANNNSPSSLFVSASFTNYNLQTVDTTKSLHLIADQVYDPDRDWIVFAHFGNAMSDGSHILVWPQTKLPTECIWIAGSGLTSGYPTPSGSNANGQLANFQAGGMSGVTLTIDPTTGTILGYAFVSALQFTMDFVSNVAPYAVKAQVAGSNGLGAFVDGSGTTSRIQGGGLCYHRGARKMWMADSANNAVRELVWDGTNEQFDVTSIAGHATITSPLPQGHVDGSAINAQFAGFQNCQVAPSTGSGPAAMFLAEFNAIRLRRLTPVTASGTVSTISHYRPDITAGNDALALDLYERADNTIIIAYASRTSGVHTFKITPEMLTAPVNFYDNALQWNSVNYTGPPNILSVKFLPDGQVMSAISQFNPTFNNVDMAIWSEGFWTARTPSRTRSQSECFPNPIQINQGDTQPSASDKRIAPISDSIFDFNSFTPSCCSKLIEQAWSVACRSALQSCTAARTGATLFSSVYLLHGQFSSPNNARAWALNCIPAYAKCMRDGHAANSPLPAHPICRWPAEAGTRLNDPTELSLFATAAIVGMNSPEALDVVDAIVFGGSSEAIGANPASGVLPPTPAPPGGSSNQGKPATPSDLLAEIPTCPTSQFAYRCPRSYGGGLQCSCPPTTLSQRISLMPHWYSMPVANQVIASLPAEVRDCVRQPMNIGMCTANTAPDQWVSAFERDLNIFILNNTEYRVGGQCLEKNPKTGTCGCPYNSSAHEFAVPVQDATTNQIVMRIVTFCMRSGTTVFFRGRVDWDVNSPECFHPFGSNFSCQCTPFATERRVPVSMFKTRSDTTPVPGELVFCDSDQVFPDQIDPAIIATTVGITIASSVAGGSLDALQAAAITMSVCNGNETGNSKKALVFAELEVAGEASGIAFILILSVGLIFAHWLAAVCVTVFLVCRGKSVPASYDTGLYPTVGGEGLSTKQIKSIEAGGLDDASASVELAIAQEQQIDHTGESQSLWDVWEYASILVRFPHYSLLVIRILFAGFAAESASLFRVGSENMIYYIIGSLGLVICILFIVCILYFSWQGISKYEEEQLFISEIPEGLNLADPTRHPKQPRDVEEITASRRKEKYEEEMKKNKHSYRTTYFKKLKEKDAGGGVISPSNTNYSSKASSVRNLGDFEMVESGRSSQASLTKKAQEIKLVVSSDNHHQADLSPSAETTHQEEEEEENNNNKNNNNNNNEDDDGIEEITMPKQVVVKSAAGAEDTSGSDDEEGKRSASASAASLGKETPMHVSEANTTTATDNSKTDKDALFFDNNNENDDGQQEIDKNLEYGLYGVPLQIGKEQVRLAPYFVWYTSDFALGKLPKVIHFWFAPQGWWTLRRGYTRRYAAFFYHYLPKYVSWAPAVTTLFLLLISLVGTTNSCEIPLMLAACVNLLMAILFLVALPLRRPLENVMVILQYVLNCALGITRGLGHLDVSVTIFYVVIGVTVLTMVYDIVVTIMEYFFMWNEEVSRFHCPETIDRDTNLIDPSVKKTWE